MCVDTTRHSTNQKAKLGHPAHIPLQPKKHNGLASEFQMLSAATPGTRAALASHESPLQHGLKAAAEAAADLTPEGLLRAPIWKVGADPAKKALFPTLHRLGTEEGAAAVPVPTKPAAMRSDTAAGPASLGAAEEEGVRCVGDRCRGEAAVLSLLPPDLATERIAAEANMSKGLTAAGWNAIQLGLWVPPAAWFGYAAAAVAKPTWFRGRAADLAWAGTTAASIYWLGTKLRMLPTLSSLITREAAPAETSAPTTAGRVLVIGAGPVGLAAIKELREAGHDVTCYEGDVSPTAFPLLLKKKSPVCGQVGRPPRHRRHHPPMSTPTINSTKPPNRPPSPPDGQ